MKLIINADDYGLTKNISMGIIDGMRRGIITDTSAIVNTCDFEECAKIAIDHGINKMGVHCLVTMGYPLLPKEEVVTLVNTNGKFYTRDEIKNIEFNVCELEKELTAQIEKFLSTGLIINHIDSHHGFMTKSSEIYDMFIRLAHKYDVPLRNEASYRNIERYNCQKFGVACVDKVYFGHATSTNEIIDYIIQSLSKYNSIEIGCHPGYSDDYLRKISPLNDDREKDLSIFMDDGLKDLICNLNIECISYSELK